MTIVLGEKVLVEEYLRQHRQELAAITPEERDKQVTEWDAHSSALQDIIYHVNKDDIRMERKKSREKRQITIHPGKYDYLTCSIVHMVDLFCRKLLPVGWEPK